MIATRYLEFETRAGEIRDITREVATAVGGSGIASGLVTVFVPGATGAVTTIEHEDGLVKDMADLLERLIPERREYAHNLRWHDGNGHSHLRASLLGPGLTIPLVEGILEIGEWQQIIFLELDNRPRNRRIVVQIIGE
ncbi:MAG: secondary thiamine-phosphate synthase enzyme YjbQ [Methanothrix sp.]|nr:secondary thiamine-phosphate synthase enzyme YjbQ [Methanothrix sp.]